MMPRYFGKSNLRRGPARAALALSALALASPQLGGADGRISHIFLRDRQTGTTERLSVDGAGGEANEMSELLAISADGRYVAFDSFASNLVPNDTNGTRDVFLRDRQTGITERLSVDGAGGEANFGGEQPAISADGRYVAFQSWSSNLVPNDTNDLTDIFLRDRQTGTTERVNLDSAGGEANAESSRPAISADGRFVAFASWASNLVPNDTNHMPDIFLRDRQTGTTERLSVDSAGGEANSFSDHPAISADGRYVAFQSFASNLVPNDTNGQWDIFVRDRQTGTTERLSLDGAVGGARPTISADGGDVAFLSWFDVPPVAQTTLSTPARAGATTLALASPDGFLGRVIVIAEGATGEETNLVTGETGRGRLRLARPLRFPHPAGTPVAARPDTLFLSANRATIRQQTGADLRGRVRSLLVGIPPFPDEVCGQNVRVEFAGFAQMLPAAGFRRRGSRCLYRPAPGEAVRRFSYDFVRGSFAARIHAPFPGPDDPVRFALAIGKAAGEERLRMEEPRPGSWRYRR